MFHNIRNLPEKLFTYFPAACHFTSRRGSTTMPSSLKGTKAVEDGGGRGRGVRKEGEVESLSDGGRGWGGGRLSEFLTRFLRGRHHSRTLSFFFVVFWLISISVCLSSSPPFSPPLSWSVYSSVRASVDPCMLCVIVHARSHVHRLTKETPTLMCLPLLACLFVSIHVYVNVFMDK